MNDLDRKRREARLRLGLPVDDEIRDATLFRPKKKARAKRKLERRKEARKEKREAKEAQDIEQSSERLGLTGLNAQQEAGEQSESAPAASGQSRLAQLGAPQRSTLPERAPPDDMAEQVQESQERASGQLESHNARQNQAKQIADGRLSEPAKNRSPRRRLGKKKSEAIRDGAEIIDSGPELTAEIVELKRRIDGSLKGAPLSAEFKRALVETYEETMGLDIKGLSAATGASTGSIWRALGEHPATLARVRQNRQDATLEDLSMSLRLMADKLRTALTDNTLTVTNKNIRDFAIAYGIFTDKHSIITGKPTAHVAFSRGESFEDRKAAMLKVLDKADVTLQLVSGGTK